MKVGLPGCILHGLWSIAQVARAHGEAVGDPLALRPRGPVPRHGLTETEAAQGEHRIIRNASAELAV